MASTNDLISARACALMGAERGMPAESRSTPSVSGFKEGVTITSCVAGSLVVGGGGEQADNERSPRVHPRAQRGIGRRFSVLA
jgi:hypothetical protein